MALECRALVSLVRNTSSHPVLFNSSPWKLPSTQWRNSDPHRPSLECGPRSRHLAIAAAVSTPQAVVEEDVVVAFPKTPLMVPYPEGPSADVFLSQHSSTEGVSKALAEYIVTAAREAVAERGLFTIALSGGSLVELLGALSSEPYVSQVDWSKWHVLWVDERFVKHTSDDSNFKQAAASFLAKVPIPEDQILPTDDEFESVEEVADDYQALLQELVEDSILTTTAGQAFPRFDLVLLGIGPEGHTASLFPNSPALRQTQRWVVPVPYAPKAPPKRVTLTMPVINSARKIAFVATGGSKAEVVQRVFERPALPGSLPAQLVRPFKGSVMWFLDDSSASRLSETTWKDAKKYPFVQMK